MGSLSGPVPQYLVKKKDSPYYQIRIKRNGKWVQRATRWKIKSKADSRAARHYIDEQNEIDEAARKSGNVEKWEHWVLDFLKTKYCQPSQARTLERYLGAWKNINSFLNLKGIKTPSQLKREQILEYYKWRQTSK